LQAKCVVIKEKFLIVLWTQHLKQWEHDTDNMVSSLCKTTQIRYLLM